MAETGSIFVVSDTNRTDKERVAHAAILAREVALDMRINWQPTAANCSARVSKERISEAVRESATEQAAKIIAAMKRADMANAAEGLLSGRGWLPQILRTPERQPA